jgi:hypothetical protein
MSYTNNNSVQLPNNYYNNTAINHTYQQVSSPANTTNMFYQQQPTPSINISNDINNKNVKSCSNKKKTTQLEENDNESAFTTSSFISGKSDVSEQSAHIDHFKNAETFKVDHSLPVERAINDGENADYYDSNDDVDNENDVFDEKDQNYTHYQNNEIDNEDAIYEYFTSSDDDFEN